MTDSQRDEITKLETLYASNPEGRVFTHLAEAYRKAGELDRARDILDEGLRRHPDYASAHVVLGRVHADQGHPAEAAAAFSRVLQLDPENLIARRSLAESDRAAGRTAEALQHYRELLTYDPSNEDVQAIVAELQASVSPPPPYQPAPEQTTQAEERWDTPSDLSTAPIDLGTFGAGEPAADEPLSLDAISFGGGMGDESAESAFGVDTGDLAFDSFDTAESAADEEEQPVDLSLADLGFDSEAPTETEPVADFGLEPEAAGEAEAVEELASLASAEEPELEELASLASAEEPDLEELASLEPAEEPDLEELAAFAEPGPAEELEAPAGFEPAALGEPEEPFEFGVAEEPPEWAAAEEPPESAAVEEPPDSAAVEEPPARAEDMPAWAALGAWGVATDAAADADAERAMEAAEGSSPAGNEASMATETLAELYRRQGFADRAAGVYRELVRQRPNDVVLRGRLEETEAEAQALRAERIGVEETREFWVSGAAAETAATPAWGEPDDEDADEGITIGQYFSGILGWRPTVMAPPTSQRPTIAAPPEGLVAAGDMNAAPPAEEEPFAQIDEPVAEVEDLVRGLGTGDISDAYMAETLTAEPESEEAPEPSFELEPPAAEPVAELFLTEADALAGGGESDELFLTEAVVEEPAVEEPAAEEPAAEEPAAEAGWDPTVELAGEVPPAAERSAAPRAGATPGAEAAAEEEAEEDDDLEMFRSWLQSLKK